MEQGEGKMEIEKVKKDGKIAVLVSHGYGAGWSTWMDDSQADVLLYHPKLVKLVEDGEKGEITEKLCSKILGIDGKEHVCTLGSDQLVVEWVEEGAQFKITEYDGAESLDCIENIYYRTA